VVVSTYQAVSGTGQKAVEELAEQVRALLSCQATKNKVYPHRIAFNCLPHIDVFLENGYTKEEMKMVNETQKIMGDDSIKVTATTGAGAGVLQPLGSGEHRDGAQAHPGRGPADISQGPGVKVVDNPAKNEYPMALDAAGQDLTLVGRIREDFPSPTA